MLMVRTVLCVAAAAFLGLLVTFFTLSAGLILAAIFSASFDWPRAVLVEHGRIYAMAFYLICLQALVAGQFMQLPRVVAISLFVAAPVGLMFWMEPQHETYQAVYGLIAIAALPCYQRISRIFFTR